MHKFSITILYLGNSCNLHQNRAFYYIQMSQKQVAFFNPFHEHNPTVWREIGGMVDWGGGGL
jgi:hypothetical protein